MPSSEKPCRSTQFVRIGVVADPVNAAAIRREFADWLGRYFSLDATKISDVVLAVNEAMANAAEYAYATAAQPGAMHVHADYDRSGSTLTVIVADEGAWRACDPATKEHKRGRGIPLMHALADRVTVDSSPAGTRVCLEWADVPATKSTVCDGLRA
jgi:anti-sigma regulatory factor (Ser/Thr protein kinase)